MRQNIFLDHKEMGLFVNYRKMLQNTREVFLLYVAHFDEKTTFFDRREMFFFPISAKMLQKQEKHSLAVFG